MELTRTITLPTSVGDTWELLTDPGELAHWLGAVGDGVLVEPDGTVRHVAIEEVVAGERLQFRWWTSVDGDDATTVVISVQGTDTGSLVEVTETLSGRAAVAGGIRRLQVGAGWDGRLFELGLLSLVRVGELARL